MSNLININYTKTPIIHEYLDKQGIKKSVEKRVDKDGSMHLIKKMFDGANWIETSKVDKTIAPNGAIKCIEQRKTPEGKWFKSLMVDCFEDKDGTKRCIAQRNSLQEGENWVKTFESEFIPQKDGVSFLSNAKNYANNTCQTFACLKENGFLGALFKDGKTRGTFLKHNSNTRLDKDTVSFFPFGKVFLNGTKLNSSIAEFCKKFGNFKLTKM